MTEPTLYTRIGGCRICDATSLREVFDLGTMALSGVFPLLGEEVPEGPLTLVQCGGCGLVQLAHNYDLPTLYGPGYGYRSGLNASMMEHLGDVAKHALRNVGPLGAGYIWLDIGSNDGSMLWAAMAANDLAGGGTPQLVGIDPIADILASSYPPSAKRIPEFFTSARVRRRLDDDSWFGVITSIACFYDVTNPRIFARDVSILLDDDRGSGVWVLEQSYLPAMLERTAYDTIRHSESSQTQSHRRAIQ
jgi:NDP-4-keto-2,6-dideoxyhexose 3-C-methyltransferase